MVIGIVQGFFADLRNGSGGRVENIGLTVVGGLAVGEEPTAIADAETGHFLQAGYCRSRILLYCD